MGEQRRQRRKREKRPSPGHMGWHVTQPHRHPKNRSPPLHVAITPHLGPFPVGAPRAATSFVEVGVQPQLPGFLQGPVQRGGKGPGLRRQEGKGALERGVVSTQPGLLTGTGSSHEFGARLWADTETPMLRTEGGFSPDLPGQVHPPLPTLHPLDSLPNLMMSTKALSRGFSWYLMPCLAHRDFTKGAILCKLCRGMVGKRLGSQGIGV